MSLCHVILYILKFFRRLKIQIFKLINTVNTHTKLFFVLMIYSYNIWYWYELNWIQLQLQIKDIDPVMILFIIIVLINLKRKYVFRWPKLLKNIFYYNVNMKTIQPQSYFTSFNNIYIYKNLQNTIFIYLKILKYSFTRVKNN